MNRIARLMSLALALGMSAAPLALSQEKLVPLAPPGAPASAFQKPDRAVAEIISPIWATEKERDAANESGQLVKLLGIAPGMSVADVGAGSGYHTVRLSRVVGPNGRVLAQDVMPNYLADLAKRLRREKLRNVTLALGEPSDPRLPPASVDVAILIHMYHEIEQPFAFMHNLVPALKPGARVGIVDLDRSTWEHGTPRELLRCELAAVGYEQIGFSKLSGEVGYLAIFKAPNEAERISPQAIKPCKVGQK